MTKGEVESLPESNDHAESGAPSGRDTAVETNREATLVVRIAITIMVLAGGILGMTGLVMLKKDPAEARVTEPSLTVNTLRVTPEDVPVTVTGLGEVRPLNVVPVSPEVAGTITGIHPRLETGEVIPSGEMLFQIDPRDYRAGEAQAAAQVAQLEQTIERLERQYSIDQERLERQYSIDQERLKTLERNETLMDEEFQRVKTLFEEDEVGTRSAVDHAEMSMNQASDAKDLLAQTVALYPVRIQEAQSALEGAEAQLTMARANLARTSVTAGFDARIKQVNLEAGQYVNPGMQVLTLADDRLLEISVSLDSRDARDWLKFQTPVTATGTSWFGELEPVPCKISWTEDPKSHCWEGTVHRIETFDPKTRTVTIAVRVSAENARSSTGGLPLVEGMFCSVEIPGEVMEQVYRLPRWSVSYEGEVYVARENRLHIEAVDIIRSEGEETFVRGGLKPGDEVITTRLVNPLPNSLLTIDVEANGAI